jgi:hypothetical protein
MRTLALRSLIGSIAASALVGIYVLLLGSFGEREERVLLTAMSVSGLSILAMACGSAFERSRLGKLPQAGALASVASFVLFMVGIWSDSGWRSLWYLAISLALLACATAFASLLSLATLARKFRWTQRLGMISAFLLAAVLILVLWAELDSEGAWRLVGVLAIVVGAVAIGVPVLHHMSEPAPGRASARQESRIRFCVACGHGLASGSDIATCNRCGARFRVDLFGE